MAVQKGDYIGFSIGDRHSSDLGIVRVSTNDRYVDNMLPVITDKTIQIPGGDGTFYFGSNYPSKPIHIDFAFDSLNDLQIREIVQVLANKKLQKLIYDESPYKYYWVKSSGQPQIKYLSFDEAIGTEAVYEITIPKIREEGGVIVLAQDYYILDIAAGEYILVPEGTPYDSSLVYYDENHQQVEPKTDSTSVKYIISECYIKNGNNYDLVPLNSIYDSSITYYKKIFNTLTTKVSKGEGSIDFVAYKSFAYSVYKFLDEYDNDNIDEWAAASGMLQSKTIGSKIYDEFKTDGSNLVSTYIYNAGEMDTDYKLIMKFNGNFIGINNFVIELDNDPTAQLQLNQIQKKGTDTYLILNTAAQILEGAIKVEDKYVKTGNIYNEYITAGNFFKLPQGESVLKITNVVSGGMTPSEYFSINYSYLYY